MNILDYLRVLNQKLEESGGSIPKSIAANTVGGEQILERLESEGYISISSFIHPSVRITEKGRAVL